MTLYIKAVSAHLVRDTDWFSKMDPYCQIKLGNMTKKTKVIKNGGKDPVWNQLMVFQAFKSYDLKIAVKDQDFLKDDQIGIAQISLQKYLQDSRQHDEQIILHHGKKPAGKLKINICYKNDSNNYQGQPFNQAESSYNSGNSFNQSGQYGGGSGPSDFNQSINQATKQLSFFGGSGTGNPFNQGSGGFSLKPSMSHQDNTGWSNPPKQNNSWGPNNNGWGQGNSSQGNQNQGNQSQGNQSNFWNNSSQGSNSGW